jgi:hypothetical protein
MPGIGRGQPAPMATSKCPVAEGSPTDVLDCRVAAQRNLTPVERGGIRPNPGAVVPDGMGDEEAIRAIWAADSA